MDTSAPLARDLALVLPEATRRATAAASAYVHGRAVEVDQAIARACELVRGARGQAVIGLSGLTIEAAREATALAEAARARLLPIPAPCPVLARSPVVQSATLGHVLSCEAAILIGDVAPAGPIIERLRGRVNHISTAPADLATIRAARQAMKQSDSGDPIAAHLHAHPRVAAILSPISPIEVIEQWHQLAAEAQQRCRLTVLSLPDLHTFGNLRGVLEVITWQSGQSCASGGVDFADGAPRPCTGASSLIARNAIDLVIDTGLHPTPLAADIQRIRLGPELDPDAEVSFVTPGLAPGLAARVMRFDGVILWLCDDPAAAIPDPAAAILARLTEVLRM